MNETYDVVVVGGGAAGLSGAVALARSRRSVLVVDAGDPRNAPADGVHNYLGLDGTPPGELVRRGRAEVTGYGGELVADHVTAAEPLADGGFGLVLAERGPVRARRLLLATGLVDELPDVPGLAARWGRDVLHCPYCHGWEVRDQAIGILGTGPMTLHQAMLFRQLSDDVTVFSHTGPALSDDEREQLAARDIAVVDGEVTGIEVTGDRLTGVRLASGEVVARAALAVATRTTARIDGFAGLGLETAELEVSGQVIATYVPSDPIGATSVPGVWVAGNITDPRGQVMASAAAGLGAGAVINADLAQEEMREAVAARRTAAVP
ncbi:NAD(P)/FAD-dependent oxidoreductase [Prauserella cavernicola]|uniref:NAD(P)/FAD-dependent oxidoreductase n=1 Tax=Prauserella cavernicola TaxID=2800127 RepID=A0A934R050_9PSEU|nr:NAD(P)/FAD-dependent oxidoreductase [Prauserella cavernicola]MBK1788474.1 NAD(P)/FAD-dependent oxidoreductase [Prauserella cavernicola]